jgi:hypothetical protein
MSSVQMGMSEKVTDHVFGTTSRRGIPFNFLMRDILQYDADLDAAISRMAEATRTCAIWLGCGDAKPDFHYANLFQYSHTVLNVIDPDTHIQYPSNSSKYIHPNIPDIVYWGVNQQCYSALLQEWNGNITAENTIKNIIPVSQTGDMHAAIYDLDNLVWIFDFHFLFLFFGSHSLTHSLPNSLVEITEDDVRGECKRSWRNWTFECLSTSFCSIRHEGLVR